MPWLRRLVGGISTRRPVFNLRSVSLRVLVDKVAPGQVFLRVSFHQYFVLIFSYELLLSERQKGKAWEPSKKEWSSGNQGAWNRKVLPLIFSVFLVHARRQAGSQWPHTADSQTARSVHVWFEKHKVTLDKFSPSTSLFSYPHHSTNILHSSSSTRCSYQNDKWAKHRNLLKSTALSQIVEHWREKYLYFCL